MSESGDGRGRTVDQVVLWLVAGLTGSKLRDACAERLGVGAEEVADLITVARRRLTVAAETDHDEEVGKAVTRLNDIYASAMLKKKFREALDAQRELNRLLGLYDEGERDGAGDDDLRDQVARAVAHLDRLGLTRKKSVDIVELCRLAESKILSLEGRK
jgi:hypothetical protein